MKKKLLLVGALAATLAFTGCGNKKEETTDTTEIVTEATEETATADNAEASEENADKATSGDAEKTAYPVTVKSSDGSEVTIEKEPEKVISMGPSITELIFSLDEQGKLIGRTNYCDYPAEAADIESIGDIYPINTELIISKEPDLVIASAHFSEEEEAALTEAGIPVLVLYDENNYEGVYDIIDTLGTALNANVKADEITSSMKAEIEDVQAEIADETPVTVYYVVGFGEYGDYTAGGDTYINDIIELAGGENIAKEVQGWNYSSESLLEADPEVILIPEYSYDEFISAEPYNQLTAVKEGKVFKIDNNMIDRQTVRNADAVKEIAQYLHPEE